MLLESIVQCGSSMRLRIRKQSEPSELDSSPILCKSNGEITVNGIFVVCTLFHFHFSLFVRSG